MKRALRVLAVVAPLLGAGCWMLWQDAAASSPVPLHRYHDPESLYYGRSRDLPATGPVAAPGGPTELEMAIPIDRAAELMPAMDLHALERPQRARAS